ncbi:MAG: amidase family protein, partial [Actinomycetota bacterium]
VPTRGLRAAVVSNWGSAVVSPAMWTVLEEAATHLIEITAMRRVDGVDTSLPRLGAAWSITGMAALAFDLRDHWPACADMLTPEMRYGLQRAGSLYGTEARGKFESRRVELSRRMTEIFDAVDVVITASNPDVAFNAEGPLPDSFGGVVAGAGNNGVLTFPANIHGNPGISIPVGTVDGLPVGLQVMSRHFAEPLLLELALAFERSRPWPLVAPHR